MTNPRRLIIQGHRGARGVLPENTMAGFTYALDAGAHVVEVDVNLGADDALLLVHDDTTHPDQVRDADGAWFMSRVPWRTLDLATIRRFDVGRLRPGSDYALRFPNQQAVDGARVPILEDLAELILQRPGTGINVEIKCDPEGPPPRTDPARFAELAVVAIHRLGISDRVTVQSFNWSVVAAVRALDPGLVTGCLSEEQPGFDTIRRGGTAPSPYTHGLRIEDFGGSLPAMIAAMDVDYWASHHGELDPASVAEAHDRGLAVYAWTVNLSDDMKRLISWGVDSIITDFPGRLSDIVREGIAEQQTPESKESPAQP